MALTQSFTRFGLATIERKVGNVTASANLASLSQRKLNALGLPLAYVDCDRRYRFVNKAFLEWTGKVYTDVIGQQVRDVMGREVFPLYEAYVEAALAGERTGFERQLHVPGRPAIWIHVDYYPDRGTDGDVRGFLVCYANVDQLKRLELEAGGREHRLRLVTDSVGSPIIHFDRNLKLGLRTSRSATGSASRPTTSRPPDAGAHHRRHVRRHGRAHRPRVQRRQGLVRAARAQVDRASCAGSGSRSSRTAPSAAASTASSR
jgi:PAS domain S-box-containing protein